MSTHRSLTAHGAMLFAVVALATGCDQAASTDEAASTHEEAEPSDSHVESEATVRKIGASASFR